MQEGKCPLEPLYIGDLVRDGGTGLISNCDDENVSFVISPGLVRHFVDKNGSEGHFIRLNTLSMHGCCSAAAPHTLVQLFEIGLLIMRIYGFKYPSCKEHSLDGMTPSAATASTEGRMTGDFRAYYTRRRRVCMRHHGDQPSLRLRQAFRGTPMLNKQRQRRRHPTAIVY